MHCFSFSFTMPAFYCTSVMFLLLKPCKLCNVSFDEVIMSSSSTSPAKSRRWERIVIMLIFAPKAFFLSVNCVTSLRPALRFPSLTNFMSLMPVNPSGPLIHLGCALTESLQPWWNDVKWPHQEMVEFMQDITSWVYMWHPECALMLEGFPMLMTSVYPVDGSYQVFRGNDTFGDLHRKHRILD